MHQQNLHLISHMLCPYVQRSIIVLEEKGIAYDRTDIDLASKPDWFNQKSPLGKVPILEVDKDKTLFESAVICEYLDEVTAGSLHPAGMLEKAFHRSWIEFGSSILNKIAALYNAKDEAQFQRVLKEIKGKLELIEREVSEPPFFEGKDFHLIDAVYGPVFRYFDVFDSFSNFALFDNLPKCKLWRDSLAQRDSVKKAVSVDYPEKLLAFLKKRESYISQLIHI